MLAATSGNVAFFATKAAMDASVDYLAPFAAWVFADPDTSNNAIYYFTDGDPGFWTYMLSFPNSWAYATVSGGTANAIELTLPSAASASTLIFFEVAANNLAGGVTISVNGADPLDGLDFRGDALAADALVAGALAVGFPLNGSFRFVIDNTATAAAAAAAANAAAADASASAAATSESNAAGSEATAAFWAQKDEDSEVAPGLFSAYHWARKAMAYVAGALGPQISGATQDAIADADIIGFSDTSDANTLKGITWLNLKAAFGGVFATIAALAAKLDITGGNIGDDAARLAFADAMKLPSLAGAQTRTDAEKLLARTNISAGIPDVIIEDQKASGMGGGATVSGQTYTRDLNTFVRNQGSLASLASNEFTLPAGRYLIRWRAPAVYSGKTQSWLHDSDNNVVKAGEGLLVEQSGNVFSFVSEGVADVVIATAKTFTIKQYFEAGYSIGLGYPVSVQGEVYTRVEITKVE